MEEIKHISETVFNNVVRYSLIILLLIGCVIVNKSKNVKIEHKPEMDAGTELIINKKDTIK